MSDDTREATLEEKRVIIAHDCAMEILTLPAEERGSVIEAISSLVDPPADRFELYERILSIAENAFPTRVVPPRPTMVTPTPPNAQMDLLGTLVQSLSNEQKLSLVRLLSPEQRALFSKIFGVELPDLPDAH